MSYSGYNIYIIIKMLQVFSVKNFVNLLSFVEVLFDELHELLFHSIEVICDDISGNLDTFYIVHIYKLFFQLFLFK